MTPEQQRIAIAEACGWEVPDHVAGKSNTKGAPPPFGRPPKGDWRKLPDYLNDLNAMAEAEKTWFGHRALSLSCSEQRDSSKQRAWEVELYNIIRRDDRLCGRYVIEMYRCANATAAQRAEAFLRTIGKWVDGLPTTVT